MTWSYFFLEPQSRFLVDFFFSVDIDKKRSIIDRSISHIFIRRENGIPKNFQLLAFNGYTHFKMHGLNLAVLK